MKSLVPRSRTIPLLALAAALAGCGTSLTEPGEGGKADDPGLSHAEALAVCDQNRNSGIEPLFGDLDEGLLEESEFLAHLVSIFSEWVDCMVAANDRAIDTLAAELERVESPDAAFSANAASTWREASFRLCEPLEASLPLLETAGHPMFCSSRQEQGLGMLIGKHALGREDVEIMAGMSFDPCFDELEDEGRARGDLEAENALSLCMVRVFEQQAEALDAAIRSHSHRGAEGIVAPAGGMISGGLLLCESLGIARRGSVDDIEFQSCVQDALSILSDLLTLVRIVGLEEDFPL